MRSPVAFAAILGLALTPAVADDVAWDAPDPLLGGADQVAGTEVTGYVHFTFDDGPKEGTTERVLDALAKYDVPATFFITTRRVTGKRGEARRALLARTAAAGHEVGSHTMTHPNLRGLGKDAQAREIDGSRKTLVAQLGRPVGLFRPPFGALSATGRALLRARGLTDVRWEPDSVDYHTPNAAKLRARVVRDVLAQGGGVVLMHDTKASTAAAIEGILDDLEAENCRRLAAGTDLIVPVSIHYFLRDRGAARPVPPQVAARTDRYRAALPARCAARPIP